MPKSADPAAPPEPSFYAPASPPFLGDPATDPAMTVRVEDWDRRFDPGVARAIKLTEPRVGQVAPWAEQYWITVSGPMPGWWLSHDSVRDWPIAHPMTYGTAFRHEEARRAQQKAAEEIDHDCAFGHNCADNGWPAGRPQGLQGDMGAEAFKGGT